jgi:hypothetical protein
VYKLLNKIPRRTASLVWWLLPTQPIPTMVGMVAKDSGSIPLREVSGRFGSVQLP